MRSPAALLAAILLVFAGSFLAKWLLVPATGGEEAEVRGARRIVSTAPSITEVLYALGCGDRVVGVTKYCDYPPEAAAKPHVGGYHNPSFAQIVGLRPDLVVMLEGAGGLGPGCRKLGLPTLVVSHKSIDGILESLATLGRACDADDAAARITADLRARIERVERKTAGLAQPRVMVVVDRMRVTGRLQDMTIAGCDGHLDAMVAMAGGQNAYRQGRVRFPVVAAEGVLSMNPEVVIDLASEQMNETRPDAQIAADWQQLPDLAAVRSGRVHVIRENYAMRPSPRFILMVEKLARLIHPEVEWGP